MKQKGVMIGAAAGFVFLLEAAGLFASQTNMVPLYQDLSLTEVGQVKEELDARGAAYEIGDGGTIAVPEKQADSLPQMKLRLNCI